MRRPRYKLKRSILAALLVSLSLSVQAQSPELKKQLEKVRKEGCLYGLFMHNLPIRLYRINRFDREAGKKPGMIMFFINWEKPFPSSDMHKIIQYGAVPHIVWEPTAHKEGEEYIYLSNIISGEWDEYIRNWAKGARDFGYPFVLRMGHEMDGNWYPWSGARNGNDPALFVKMWKHVHALFRQAGAENVLFAWTPMNVNVVGEEWNEFYHYYPGGEFVDFIGMDLYNWGDSQAWSRWTSFADLIAGRYYEMIERYGDKPMIIGEFASASTGGDKALWIKEAFEEIKTHYPAVKAFVWFNINKECDWRLQATEESLESFRQSVSDPYFLSDAEKIAQYFRSIVFPVTAMKELKALPPDAFDKREEMRVLFTQKEPPVVDGSLSDWPGGGFVILSKENLVLETEAWQGEGDVSGRAGIMLTKDDLYVAFDMTDDVPGVNAQKWPDMWKGDSVEVAFNFKPEADPERNRMTPDDFQVIIPAVPEGAQAYSWQLKGEIKDAAVSVVAREQGYIVEAKIPLSSFPFSYRPSPGQKVAIDFAVNDSDKNIREHQLLWSGDQMFYEDPSVWGCGAVELLP